MTKRWGGSVRVAVGVVVGVLAMAGCTGEPGPIVTHDVTSTWTPPAVESPTPSPTISPTADVDPLAALPEDARCDLLTCAKETAEFYLHEVDRARTTGDITLLELLGTSDCAYCGSVQQNILAMIAAGTHVEGGASTTDENSWRYELDTASGRAFVSVSVSNPERTLVDVEGGVLETTPAFKVVKHTELSLIEGQWRIVGVSIEDLP